MAGGYLGNVYNEYATGSNLMKVATNILGGATNTNEQFADNQDLANLFGMLGMLIILAIIVVLGYKFFIKTRKH